MDVVHFGDEGAKVSIFFIMRAVGTRGAERSIGLIFGEILDTVDGGREGGSRWEGIRGGESRSGDAD